MATRSTLHNRILDNIEKDSNGCWIWQLTVGKGGYGRIKHERKFKQAHRFSYEVFVGTIPSGLQIDHLCRNRSCVNPKHLEPVTAKENLHRGLLKERWAEARAITHCPKGHEYTPENTLIKKNSWGNDCRNCRMCHRIRERNRYWLSKQPCAEVF